MKDFDEKPEKKGRFISVDDIERRNKIRERERFKTDITEDINDVIGKISFSKPKNKKRSLLATIGWFVLVALVGLIIINLILGNIWLLKFFITDFSEIIKGWFT